MKRAVTAPHTPEDALIFQRNIRRWLDRYAVCRVKRFCLPLHWARQDFHDAEAMFNAAWVYPGAAVIQLEWEERSTTVRLVRVITGARLLAQYQAVKEFACTSERVLRR